MPRTKEENERIKAERKKEILQASLPIFAEKGLSAAKISDIANAAGISYGLIYSYFPSKEHIFIELINDYITEGKDLINEIESMNISPLEKILKVFEILFESNRHDSQAGLFFRLFLQLNFSPHLWKDTDISDFFDDPVYKYLSHMIEQGQNQGIITKGNSSSSGLILGFIAVGMNIGGEEMKNANIEFSDISENIAKIYCFSYTFLNDIFARF